MSSPPTTDTTPPPPTAPTHSRSHSLRASQGSDITVLNPDLDSNSSTPQASTPVATMDNQKTPRSYTPGSKSRSASPSNQLPPGCTWGTLPPGTSLPPPPKSQKSKSSSTDSTPSDTPGPGDPVIWVDFPPSSPENPFFFKSGRKIAIVSAAVFFTFITAFAASGWSIGLHSLQEDLHLDNTQAIAGLALYAWGFGIAPLVLAPLSEEFGRKWTCLVSVFIYWLTHLFFTLGKNLATLLVGRLIQGAAGSIGATLVGGTISDIYVPDQRGLPMAVFGASAIAGTGLGGTLMAFVEANPRLEWRWIQWMQFIFIGVYLPIAYLVLRETRATVLLRRKAHRMRKHDPHPKGRYTARSEVEKVKFVVALRQSLSRPLTFLVVEPIVTFFALWIGLCWGVFYIMIAGLPYVFENIFQFSITGVGLTYLTLVIGAVIGFGFNFLNESLYHKYKAKRGVEARLYLPMCAGISFTVGCLIFGFTSVAGVHWMGACVGLVIIIASVLTIYICVFTYLSECYGSYASSAIAAQSFLRNIFGGCFSFFTHKLFVDLTPRWGIFLFACIAGILAAVPFVAFYYGPLIRSKSLYSKELMAAEQARIEAEEMGECDRGEAFDLHVDVGGHHPEAERHGDFISPQVSRAVVEGRQGCGEARTGNVEGEEEFKGVTVTATEAGEKVRKP